MKVHTKLLAAFSVLLVTLVIVAVFSLRGYGRIHARFQVLKDDIVPGAIAMAEMAGASHQVAHDLMAYLETAAPEEKENVIAGLRSLEEAGNAHLQHERHLGRKEQEAAQELVQRIAELNSAATDVINLKEHGASREQCLRIYAERLDPTLDSLCGQLKAHKAVHMKDLAAAEEAVRQANVSAIRLGVIVPVAAVALTFILAFLLTRSIVLPIRRLHEGAQRIGAGELDHRVDIQTGDEIEQLAGEFNRMAAALSQSYASLERKVAERTAELERANRQMEEDIAERKRAEDQLREAKQHAENYLDIAGVMLAAADADGDITLINKKGCEILGYRREELLGKNWLDLLVPESIRDEVRGVFHKLMAGDIEPVEYYENALLTKDGDERLLAFHNTVTKDASGRITGVLFSAEDITERRRAEEQLHSLNTELERSNRNLQDFTYTVSHDLQAPLRKIHAFGDFLEEDCGDVLPEEGRQHLHRIQEAAVRMKGLIEHLLKLARVGMHGGELVPVEPRRLIEDVLEDLSATISESGAEVTIEDPLPGVMADPVQLRQVFQNLLDNALKFRSPDRPLKVRISARLEGGQAVFSVADNGIGIEQEYQEKIFGIFQRLHHREDYEGEGVGLALCKKIVLRHGGAIRVESERGKGATFYFTLSAASGAGRET